jgi:uncharacterized protein (TIGR03437 family)
MVAGLLAAPAGAQTYNQFDNSANGTLKGNYFVREVLVTNVNGQGTVGDALSAIGTAAFDGAGNYAFNGIVMQSNPSNGEPQQTTRSYAGTYALAPNGFLQIQSLLGTYIDSNGNTQIDVAFGGVGAAGPNAFVASATEALNYDLFIGIPIGASPADASFSGTYNAAYLDFSGGDATQIRNATLQQFTADGKGNLGDVAVSGYAASQNSTLLSQTASGVTYSLSGITGGTINFGSSATLIGGGMAFMVSPDGKLVLGGSLTDYDMLVGAPAVSNASDALYKGLYFLGAIEDDASELAAESLSGIDTFWGSSSVTGAGGIYISHLRFDETGNLPYDYTYNDNYSVPGNGIFQPTNDSDRYMLGANGQVVIMSGQGTWYSLMVGLQVQNPSGSGVFLNPQGIVNAANWAPVTNPVAPLEMVVLVGAGMASSDWDATTLPLPTETPDGVQVLINGTAAPLFRVRASFNPQLIYALVPSGVSPSAVATESVNYATFQVVNKGAKSQPVTLYTNYTAPGVFAVSEGGVGPAAALHANGSLVTSADPANVNETVELFLTGLGGVTPAVPDGALPTSSTLDAAPSVYIDTWDSQLPFAGPAPCCVGLDQVNVTMPAVSSAGDWYLYVDAGVPAPPFGAETAEATINVATSAPAGVAGLAPQGRASTVRRPLRATHHGIPRVNGRTPVSGRLPHTAQ